MLFKLVLYRLMKRAILLVAVLCCFDTRQGILEMKKNTAELRANENHSRKLAVNFHYVIDDLEDYAQLECEHSTFAEAKAHVLKDLDAIIDRFQTVREIVLEAQTHDDLGEGWGDYLIAMTDE